MRAWRRAEEPSAAPGPPGAPGSPGAPAGAAYGPPGGGENGPTEAGAGCGGRDRRGDGPQRRGRGRLAGGEGQPLLEVRGCGLEAVQGGVHRPDLHQDLGDQGAEAGGAQLVGHAVALGQHGDVVTAPVGALEAQVRRGGSGHPFVLSARRAGGRSQVRGAPGTGRGRGDRTGRSAAWGVSALAASRKAGRSPPPCTMRLVPLMYEASGEARNRQASAMSAGAPMRRSGTVRGDRGDAVVVAVVEVGLLGLDDAAGDDVDPHLRAPTRPPASASG